MPNITTNHAITYTNIIYVNAVPLRKIGLKSTVNSNHTENVSSVHQLSIHSYYMYILSHFQQSFLTKAEVNSD